MSALRDDARFTGHGPVRILGPFAGRTATPPVETKPDSILLAPRTQRVARVGSMTDRGDIRTKRRGGV
jgi:hypothetical protein